MIAEDAPDHDPERYAPDTTEVHHHLVCTSCGQILDVPVGEQPSLSADARHGHDIAGVEVTFRGTCPTCCR